MIPRRSILYFLPFSGFQKLLSQPVTQLTELPNLKLETNQQPVHFMQWKQKLTVINFWATWCGPCREEMKDLQKLSEQYSGRIHVLGIALDQLGWREVTPFIRQHDLKFPVALVNQRILRAFGYRKMPEPVPQTFVFLPGGKLVLHIQTALSLEDFSKIIEQIR